MQSRNAICQTKHEITQPVLPWVFSIGRWVGVIYPANRTSHVSIRFPYRGDSTFKFWILKWCKLNLRWSQVIGTKVKLGHLSRQASLLMMHYRCNYQSTGQQRLRCCVFVSWRRISRGYVFVAFHWLFDSKLLSAMRSKNNKRQKPVN